LALAVPLFRLRFTSARQARFTPRVGGGSAFYVRHHRRTEFMTAQDQKLCERCRERPATFHVCYGHTGESKHLCEQCYRESASPGELASSDNIRDIVRNGKCRFCGQPAVGGSGGSLGAFIGAEHFLWCERCRRDLVEFAQRPENAIPEFPFDDEAAQKRVSQQMAERERRQDEFIRQRVSERRSEGGA